MVHSMVRRKLKLWILITIIVVLFTSLIGLHLRRVVGPIFPYQKEYLPQYEVDGDSCIEKHNIVFLKTHKTGSSTVANIMQRFGHSRDLNFALPRKKPGQVRYNYFGDVGDTISLENTMSSKPKQNSYNILYNHVIFNCSKFEQMFPHSMVYFTVLRHPLTQFQSAVLYFIHQQDIYRVVTKNVTEYLMNPAPFEPGDRYMSFTDNRQALDLGIPPDNVRNIQFIKHYRDGMNKVLDLVMIMEYFDESLIMLKRKMCWKTKDILYIRKNTGYRNFSLAFSATDKRLHRKWALADYMLYDFFHEQLVSELKRDLSIVKESLHFKQILLITQSFCNRSSESRIEIASSPWNEKFSVTSLDCAYLRLGELEFLNKLLYINR